MAASVEVPDEEMLRDFKAALHENLKAGKLTGIALVTGLKAIAAMIAAAEAAPADLVDDKPFSVIDHLDALPKSEGQKLLRREITRLREEVHTLEEALVATEGSD